MDNLHIGDAVIPRSDPEHDVMTIYDFELGFSIALCNWVVGTRMFKAKYPCKELLQVKRHVPRRAA